MFYKWIEEHPTRVIIAVDFNAHTKENHAALKRAGFRKTTAVAVDNDGLWVTMYEKSK